MENKVLAVVGGREITASQVDEIIARYPAQQRAMLETEQGKRNVLEQAIAFELMYDFGRETGVDKTDAYKDQLEKIGKELISQMVMSKTLSEVTVTDEEALSYYNDHKDMFGEPANVTAKHILVDLEEECQKIREEIASGSKTFEVAAGEYSKCPSKEQGGNLGAFSKGMMVPEFEEAAFNLPLGEVSNPVKTQFGYHLIKVEDKKEASVKTFEEVKSQVVNQLIQERQQRKYLDFINELREKYGVKMV
ncbi:peptidylprolyl isomerase [Clostridium tarantellae]|uniref:Peptidylprolyl isomerase n=1 Tax=Clostridium tarantellae TaxID=39493 RepID=A0A6I1MJX3_9CLOT|nr:peptidylprolyl isomerase [Clostridium tarantellae]MPQ43244.1 peptidylprolyl isomerase [Clostridium tarantellae]